MDNNHQNNPVNNEPSVNNEPQINQEKEQEQEQETNKPSEKEEKVITVHAYDWKVHDEFTDEGHLAIFCWALDRDSKPYLLRFHDFPAYCHLELPLYIGNNKVNWSGYKAQQVFETICYKLGDQKPFKYFFGEKEKLYYYRGGKKYPMLTLLFNNIKSMYACKNKLSKPFNVKDLGLIATKVWETNISPIRKLLTLRNVKYSQWFEINGVKVVNNEKVSKLDNEYVVDRFSMNPIPAEQTSSWITKPLVLAYDIETYSDRHKALPDPYSSKHVAYMISCVFQRIGDPASRITYIILYGDCSPTQAAIVIKVDSEIAGIDKFADLVNEHDPDIITGYNIFSYDNPYIDTRLKRRLREWKPMGRLINEPTVMKSFSWGSSGYGHNEINIPETDGRLWADLLPIIKRDYKLPLYNLGFVSTHFLGRTKHPITAKEMFETYELYLDSNITPELLLKDYLLSKTGLIGTEDIDNMEKLYSKLHLTQYMKLDDQENPIIKVSSIPNITLRVHALEEMRKVVEYCAMDSLLVLDIFDTIHCWISLLEMSNVMGVTPVELFTRGQQLRVQSQVYDEAAKDNIILDERKVAKMEYAGGFVYEPNPGIYHNIPCLDFKSLYPSVMISHNIDYRTFIPPEMMDVIPDEKCHVIEWEEIISGSDLDNKETKEDKEDKETKEDKEEKDEEESDEDNEVKGKVVKYRYKFIKEEYLVGILPRRLTKLIAERDAVRETQKKFKKDSMEWILCEKKQLALKISSNSMYGGLGAQTGGKLPLPEAAACVTAKSRESIQVVYREIESRGHSVIYGDTDSCMPDVGIKDSTKAHAISKQLAEELSLLFPPPMKVEFEGVYHTMLCIKKKMYLCIKMGRDGTPILNRDQLTVKGVVPARRDNCKYQRECYIDTAWKILLGETLTNTYNYIVELCLKLVRREVPWQDLVVIKGLGSHYKNASYCMKVFSDELCKIGKPASPGDRLEYVIVKSHGITDKQLLGYKMRLPSTYLERLLSEIPEIIDYEYYMEKSLMNCIQKQLFQIGYKIELHNISMKYLDKDRDNVLNEMRHMGYTVVIEQLMIKYNNNKEEVIKYLLGTDLKKVINPLISYHIKKRGRIITRVCGEPIKMMVKLIQQKQKCMESIKKYIPVPKNILGKKIPTLKILTK